MHKSLITWCSNGIESPLKSAETDWGRRDARGQVGTEPVAAAVGFKTPYMGHQLKQVSYPAPWICLFKVEFGWYRSRGNKIKVTLFFGDTTKNYNRITSISSGWRHIFVL